MTEYRAWTGSTPGLRVLSDEQIQAIHQASLEVLQQTGYHVPVAEARDLLQAAGARVVEERVYISEGLVEQALKTIHPVTIYNRLGEPVLPLAEGRVTFGTLADTIFVLDPYERINRPFIREDQAWFARVLDALPNIDWVQCVGQSKDVPNELQTQLAVLTSMRNTSKPIWTLPYQRADVLDILDLLWIIAGSRQAFEDKPFFVCASVPAAPLYGTEQNIEILLTCAEAGVPVVTYSCPAIGGNSPCDVVGAMVLANADWLANVVMHQLKRPGAPICTAGFTVQVMDMSTTLWSYSAPEAVTAYAAVADLAHWYGMPAWGLEMCTDSPRLDAQAGVEMMAECFRAMSSGVNMVHNAGLVGAGKLCAAEGVILADEIISYTRAMMQPPHVNAANLAENVALINEVGPMGEYVSHAHTLQQFRNVWYPTLFDRAMFDPQQVDGRTQLLDRLNSRARHLIETAEPFPLPDDVLREMDALEISWLSRVVVQ